jgi:uncharacterized DUF497 family protein
MLRIIWDPTPNGNIAHVEEHDLTIEEVEHILANPSGHAKTRDTQRPCVFGYTPDGCYIIVIYEEVGEDTIYPVTAFEVPEP